MSGPCIVCGTQDSVMYKLDGAWRCQTHHDGFHVEAARMRKRGEFFPRGEMVAWATALLNNPDLVYGPVRPWLRPLAQAILLDAGEAAQNGGLEVVG